MKAARVFGSLFRSTFDRGVRAPADADLLASIEKLNRVSDAMLESCRDPREQAIDDTANNR